MSDTNAATAPAAGTPAASGASAPTAEPPTTRSVPAVGELAKEPVGGNAVAGGSEPIEAANNGLERRAANLARAKRESARALQERQKLVQERAVHAEALKKAAEWDRLTELRQKQGDYALFKELGADFGKASRQYIDETTGVGKNPAEVAREEARKAIAEDRVKALEEADKKAVAEETQRQRQALIGAQRQIESMIASEPEKYELCNSDRFVSVAKAWKLVEDYHARTGQILDFRKAIDAVETDFEDRMSKSKKVQAALEKQKAAALEAAKAQPKVKGAAAKPVETEEAPKSPPTLTKRPRPMDMLKLARQMGINHKAAQDN